MGNEQKAAFAAQMQAKNAAQGSQPMPPPQYQPSANPAPSTNPAAFNPVAQMQGGIGLSPEYIQQLIALANPGGILRAGQMPQGDPTGQQFLLGATTSPMPSREAFTKTTSKMVPGPYSPGVSTFVPRTSSSFDEIGYQQAMDQWEKARYGRV